MNHDKECMIKCQDDINGDIYEKDLFLLLREIYVDLKNNYKKCFSNLDIVEDTLRFKCEYCGTLEDTCYIRNLVINKKKCSIVYSNGYYCGYVLDKIENDYVPYGEECTCKQFDCAHSTDIKLDIEISEKPLKDATFKTFKFVYNELSKLTSK